MKKIIQYSWSLFVLLAVVSCNSAKPTVTSTETNTKTVTETIHDTVFKTEIDSSTYKALLECRDGKVVVKNVMLAEPGRKLKSPRVRMDNNVLNIDCTAKAEELFANWKSKEIKEIQFVNTTITKYINVLSFWQQLQIKGFYFLVLVLIMLCLWQFIKSKL